MSVVRVFNVREVATLSERVVLVPWTPSLAEARTRLEMGAPPALTEASP